MKKPLNEVVAMVCYNEDPMGTCCVENQLYDEYNDIGRLVASGWSIKEAFDQQFWEDCLPEETIKKLESLIS